MSDRRILPIVKKATKNCRSENNYYADKIHERPDAWRIYTTDFDASMPYKGVIVIVDDDGVALVPAETREVDDLEYSNLEYKIDTALTNKLLSVKNKQELEKAALKLSDKIQSIIAGSGKEKSVQKENSQKDNSKTTTETGDDNSAIGYAGSIIIAVMLAVIGIGVYNKITSHTPNNTIQGTETSSINNKAENNAEPNRTNEIPVNNISQNNNTANKGGESDGIEGYSIGFKNMDDSTKVIAIAMKSNAEPTDSDLRKASKNIVEKYRGRLSDRDSGGINIFVYSSKKIMEHYPDIALIKWQPNKATEIIKRDIAEKIDPWLYDRSLVPEGCNYPDRYKLCRDGSPGLHEECNQYCRIENFTLDEKVDSELCSGYWDARHQSDSITDFMVLKYEVEIEKRNLIPEPGERHFSVQPGANECEVRMFKGEPDDMNITYTSYGKREQWIYEYSDGSGAMYVYIEDGTVTTVQYR